jgi:hypothetical protein
VANIIGVSVARAGLSAAEENLLLDFVEAFDPIARRATARPKNQNPWCRFWS